MYSNNTNFAESGRWRASRPRYTIGRVSSPSKKCAIQPLGASSSSPSFLRNSLYFSVFHIHHPKFRTWKKWGVAQNSTI